jgi:UDP-N-acetylglucosamine 2-epimerase (non-hydrolysing)
MENRQKVFLVAGARPNFMKIAPVYREALNHPSVDCRIVHTGQHYDYEMSQAFFEDLDLPRPDFFLEAGSGSHAVQTAKIMVAFEQLCDQEIPDLVMVVGDVNSTLACAVVAKKGLIQVGHVEAGLRSFDLTMPEEINRMVTDALSDYFFVTEKSGINNLLKEGKPENRIHFVGNVMVDNLFHQVSKLQAARLEAAGAEAFPSAGVKAAAGDYAFLTLHRPANVDHRAHFQEIISALNEIARTRTILFPVHPRTEKMLKVHGIELSDRIKQLPPLGFLESLFLWKEAKVVLTDSGGLQEETTALGVPCVTLRDNTERPITLEMGSNVLGGTRRESILAAYEQAINGKGRGYGVPPKWDGKAAERIWEVINPAEAGSPLLSD